MGKRKLTSLQKIFWKFLIALLFGLALSVRIPFLLLSLMSNAGYVTYANSAEYSVQNIAPIIASAPDITKVAIPSCCKYLIFDKNYKILYTNMDPAAQKDALDFAKTGENKDFTNRRQYRFISREAEYCILEYYVGSQYTSDWLQEHLPAPEILLFFFIGLNCTVVCIYLTVWYSRRLKSQLNPLIAATEQIQQQNLDFDVGNSNISEYNAVLQSISKMKESLKDSLEKQWLMEQKQRQQIAALAHDLKTPLTVIQGNIDLLDETPLTPKQKGYVKYVSESSEQMTLYIKILIEMLKTSTGYILNKEILVIQDFLKNIEPKINGICCVKGISFQLLQPKEPMSIFVDKMLLERVIMNIIDNAIAYTPENGLITAEVKCLDMDKVSIRILDNGSGFSMKALKHATEQFFMEEDSRGTKLHFGMGLYIAKTIIEQHNGQLFIANQNNVRGAVVTIQLPLAT